MLQRPIVQTDEITPGAIPVLVYSEDRFDLTTIPMSRELVELIFGGRLKVHVEGRYAQHPLDAKAFTLVIDRVLPENEEPTW